MKPVRRYNYFLGKGLYESCVYGYIHILIYLVSESRKVLRRMAQTYKRASRFEDYIFSTVKSVHR